MKEHMVFTADIELTTSMVRCLITEARGQQVVAQEATGPDPFSTLLACIKAGAHEFDCSLRELLKHTAVVNLKVPDLVTEILTSQTGAQIGLLVSRGHEADVYGAGDGNPSVLAAILSRDLVVGVEEETNASGEPVIRPHEADVQEKMSYLLNLGCSIVAVCLKHASLNPANEVRLQEIAFADYPRHYLGAVPVLISSDFSDEKDDALRMNICLLNAYTWFNIYHFLRRVENVLRQNNYSRNLKVVQTNGEAVPINRVTPLKTCGSEQITNIHQVIGTSVTV